jgi:hypothetical protein
VATTSIAVTMCGCPEAPFSVGVSESIANRP